MKLTLDHTTQEAPDTMSFFFRSDTPLEWKAGQYFHYTLPHPDPDSRKTERIFTDADAPYEGFVRITTRFAEKGSSFKNALKTMKPGDTIDATGPEGEFTVDDPTKDAVFIAGGIGITPFRSIIKQAEHEKKSLQATLLYANRKNVAAYEKELEAMAKRNPRFKIHYLFHPQRIDEQTIKALVPDLKTPLFYVSGPESMVEAIGKMLQQMGVPKKRIKQDWFPGYPAE